MPKIVRRGDPGSHGGEISEGAATVFAEKKAVARIGDIYDCPIHGPNEIVEGSFTVFAEKKRVVRDGDKAACGAAMISRVKSVFADDGGG